MRKFAAGLTAAVFVLMTMGAAAATEFEKGVISISPMFGGYSFDSDKKLLDLGKNASVGLGYYFNHIFQAELVLGMIHTDPDIPSGKDDVYAFQTRLDFLCHMMPEYKFDPYMVFGVGGMFYDANEDYEKAAGLELDNIFQVNFGLGMNYYIKDNMALRADARYFYGFEEESDKEFAVTAGLVFYFGDKRKPHPCADKGGDSDGDGVCDDVDLCPKTPLGVPVSSSGCPIQKATPYTEMQKTSGTGQPIAVSDQRAVTQVIPAAEVIVYFDLDQTVIKKEYEAQLKEIAQRLKQYPAATATIQGYTCDLGSEKYNMNLSKKRAERVRDYLVKTYGVDASRLNVEWFGESNPAESNATDAGRQKNRRAEIESPAVTITVIQQ